METLAYFSGGYVLGVVICLVPYLRQRARLAALYRELSWIAEGLKLVQGMSEERCQEAFHWSKEEAITKYMQRLERLIPYEYMRRFK